MTTGYAASLRMALVAMTLATGNGAVKEAMALQGRSAGPNRSPIAPLSDEKKQKLRHILEKAGVI